MKADRFINDLQAYLNFSQRVGRYLRWRFGIHFFTRFFMLKLRCVMVTVRFFALVVPPAEDE